MKIILILLLVVAKVIYFQCILLKTCIISELSQLFLFSFYSDSQAEEEKGCCQYGNNKHCKKRLLSLATSVFPTTFTKK